MSELVDWKIFKAQMLADPDIRREYDALEEEFAAAAAPECHSDATGQPIALSITPRRSPT